MYLIWNFTCLDEWAIEKSEVYIRNTLTLSTVH